MYYIQGLHSGEIAEKLNVSQPGVQHGLHRSIEILREWYRGGEQDDYIIVPQTLWGQVLNAQKRVPVPRPERTPRIKMRPFEEARAFVHALNLRSMQEWERWCHTNPDRPKDIPVVPNVTYRNEYKGHDDWLGIDRKYWEYEKVVEFMRTVILPMGITTQVQWHEAYHRLCQQGVVPINVPRTIHQVYKGKGFISWGVMMGTNKYARHSKEIILPYKEAKKYVQEYLVPIGITNMKIYTASREHIPHFLPSDPVRHYGKQYKGPRDFFGEGAHASKHSVRWPYEKARQWVIKNLVNSPFEINTSNRWMNYIAGKYPKAPRLPDGIPKDPRYYKKNGAQWVDWNHWFGVETGLKQKEREALAALVVHLRQDMKLTWKQIQQQAGVSESTARHIYHEFVPKEDRMGGLEIRSLRSSQKTA
jgi:hypothetical protein